MTVKKNTTSVMEVVRAEPNSRYNLGKLVKIYHEDISKSIKNELERPLGHEPSKIKVEDETYAVDTYVFLRDYGWNKFTCDYQNIQEMSHEEISEYLTNDHLLVGPLRVGPDKTEEWAIYKKKAA